MSYSNLNKLVTIKMIQHNDITKKVKMEFKVSDNFKLWEDPSKAIDNEYVRNYSRVFSIETSYAPKKHETIKIYSASFGMKSYDVMACVFQNPISSVHIYLKYTGMTSGGTNIFDTNYNPIKIEYEY